MDLFCGIGYFTLAALVHAGADKLSHIYACDWNSEALKVTNLINRVACLCSRRGDTRARDRLP